MSLKCQWWRIVWAFQTRPSWFNRRRTIIKCKIWTRHPATMMNHPIRRKKCKHQFCRRLTTKSSSKSTIRNKHRSRLQNCQRPKSFSFRLLRANVFRHRKWPSTCASACWIHAGSNRETNTPWINWTRIMYDANIADWWSDLWYSCEFSLHSIYRCMLLVQLSKPVWNNWPNVVRIFSVLVTRKPLSARSLAKKRHAKMNASHGMAIHLVWKQLHVRLVPISRWKIKSIKFIKWRVCYRTKRKRKSDRNQLVVRRRASKVVKWEMHQSSCLKLKLSCRRNHRRSCPRSSNSSRFNMLRHHQLWWCKCGHHQWCVCVPYLHDFRLK